MGAELGLARLCPHGSVWFAGPSGLLMSVPCGMENKHSVKAALVVSILFFCSHPLLPEAVTAAPLLFLSREAAEPSSGTGGAASASLHACYTLAGDRGCCGHREALENQLPRRLQKLQRGRGMLQE